MGMKWMNKGDKFPFAMRIAVIMVLVYLFIVLTATWYVKENYINEMERTIEKCTGDISEEIKQCRYTGVDSAAYDGGINTAQAAAVVRNEQYNLFKSFYKYDGNVDVCLYKAKVDDEEIVEAVEPVVPKTPVLIGSPLMSNSKIMVFADSLSDSQMKLLQRAYDGETDTSYIEKASGYLDGRLFYPTEIRIETQNGESLDFKTKPRSDKGKFIKTSFQDYQILMPDGKIIGSYGKEEKMSDAFREESRDEAVRSMIGSSAAGSSMEISLGGKNTNLQRIEWLGVGNHMLVVSAEANPWLYAVEKLQNFYILTFIIILVMALLLMNWISGVVENKLESERRRRLMMDSFAHEIKNPLGVIRSSGEYILDEKDEDKRHKYTKIIIDESARIGEAVAGILDLSKMEAGTYPMELSEFSPKAVVDEDIEKIKPLLKEKDLDIDFISEPDRTVFADKKLISSAISNFLLNAVYHAYEGSTIVLSVNYSKSKFKIKVHNKGKAIDENQQYRIWNAYCCGERGSGSGLGLSVVRNACALHGGSCGCVNENGGVTFWADFGRNETTLHKAEMSTSSIINVTHKNAGLKGLPLVAAGTIIQGWFGSFIIGNAFFRSEDIITYVTTIFDAVMLTGMAVGLLLMIMGACKLSKKHKAVVPVRILLLLAVALTVVCIASAFVLDQNDCKGLAATLDVADTVLAVIMLIVIVLLGRIYENAVYSEASSRIVSRMKRSIRLFVIVVAALHFTTAMGWTIYMPAMVWTWAWFAASLFIAISWIRTYRKCG